VELNLLKPSKLEPLTFALILYVRIINT